ncbi:hypothetical protein Tco_0936688 [Tanacetum coccineum]|uniref:Uncharacterized protein n=1 Tax=Tanacetum coccineum TaxID=301880 RepID=A0ABQ5DEV4_9ASTR
MADDRPMWGNNRAIATTPGSAIVAVDLGYNFIVKGHHLSMIKDRQFDGREMRGFTQYPNESLVDAWLHMKDLLRSCHRHGLGRGTIIQIFHHGLDEATQAILDGEGIFLYKTHNEAHQLLEDRVLLKLDWSKDIKANPLWKTVAFAERYARWMKQLWRTTPIIECDDKPMGGPKEEEANYAYGGYQGNYYGRSFENWRDRQPRDDNQNLQPREDNPSNSLTPENKLEESEFEKTMREFNHQAAIQDLETKFGRLSDQCSTRPTGSLPSNTQTNPKPNPTNDKPYRPPPARNEHVNAVFTQSGKTYEPPVNPNAKTIIIHDDSEDEADEVESSSSKQAKSDPPPLKA